MITKFPMKQNQKNPDANAKEESTNMNEQNHTIPKKTPAKKPALKTTRGPKVTVDTLRETLTKKFSDIACAGDMNCRQGLSCAEGMACGGGNNPPCDVPFYAPIQDYELMERNLERRLLAEFAHLEPDEMVFEKQLKKKGMQTDQDLAAESALKKLEEAGRPLCRRDFLEVMNTAIRERVKAYKKSGSMRTAAWLLTSILCRERLMDALMKETGEAPRHSA